MARIQLRRDTAANWTAANPILAAGEVGVEFTSDPALTEKFKIGDGVTAWTSLPYFSATAGAHSHVESDTTNLVTDLAAKYAPGGTDVAVADGGTGASTAPNARTNLGLIIGTDIPALAHNHAGADINSGTIATARLGSGTADNTTFLRGDQTWATPAGGGSPVYPWQVDVNVLMSPPLNVGAWAPAQRAYIYGGIVSNGNGALNDNAGWDVVLSAGTWTLEVMRYMGTDSGKETWALDDGAGNFTDLGIVDDYVAGATSDSLATITGIVVGSTIKRRLRVTSTTKNASSSGQYLRIQHAQFRRTA